MYIKNVLILAAFAVMSIAAPLPSDGLTLQRIFSPSTDMIGFVVREVSTPESIYGTAHTLKMAEDDFKKREVSTPESIYGTAHTLKMAEDDF